MDLVLSSTYNVNVSEDHSTRGHSQDYGENSNVGQAYYGRFITNPTRCFKCNGVEHIAINCPTKRTLVFCEDLNGWIEKDEDDLVKKFKELPLLKPMRNA
ncbi:hypothetical protein M9H77_30559 [Catharanthus roseus]|uniref:Uncharacterized protein n=1 Tax=Catharanthus roseus TaxID=4058 RepID=A0ACC0A081_CATRO|nr:hypothetical protein M9H77_30559 [Catharanthus roseus]